MPKRMPAVLWRIDRRAEAGGDLGGVEPPAQGLVRHDLAASAWKGKIANALRTSELPFLKSIDDHRADRNRALAGRRLWPPDNVERSARWRT